MNNIYFIDLLLQYRSLLFSCYSQHMFLLGFVILTTNPTILITLFGIDVITA